MNINISIGYKANETLCNNVELSFDMGGITHIIGENGTGKSTLYKTLLGELRPLSGHVPVDVKKNIAVISDYISPPPELKVIDILDFIGKKDIEYMKKNFETLTDIIATIKNQKISQLSTGQKRIAEIFMALSARKRILILDEATSMLDPEGRRELIQTVQEIRKDYQMTVVSITHDLEEVAMSDRVLVMKKGQVESTSSPRELFSRDDLDQIGLDNPFTNQLRESLKKSGYQVPDNYLTEGELEDKLWELL